MPKLSYKIRTKSDFNSNSPKGSSFLLTTILSLSFTLLSICYTLVWGIVLLFTIERHSYPSNCKNLVDWGRGLYFIQLLSSFLHLIASIIQLISNYKNVDSAIPKIMMSCKGCINCVIGVIILIGVNVAYFKTKNVKRSESLQKVMLVYIICEWTIMGAFILCVCLVCSISIICKKMKKHYKDDGELSDEENDI